MKIIYLILAHNNFVHLNRLIETLNDKDVVFYIHIDRKSSTVFNPQYENVKILPYRYDINWGGFSMVDATLALMEYAYSDSRAADYFILISGVDYPIRKKEFLYDLLGKGKEYIDMAPVPVPFKPVERYNHYYFDFKRRGAKISHPLIIAEIILKKINVIRKPSFKIYAGTQWFAITNDCLRYILETVKNDMAYIKFFRHTLVPDEAFFQTIIGNSPFAGNVSTSLTYTDWGVPDPPALINEKHIEFLKTHIEFNDEYGRRFPFFARKFDDDSLPLLKMVKDVLY